MPDVDDLTEQIRQRVLDWPDGKGCHWFSDLKPVLGGLGLPLSSPDRERVAEYG